MPQVSIVICNVMPISIVDGKGNRRVWQVPFKAETVEAKAEVKESAQSISSIKVMERVW